MAQAKSRILVIEDDDQTALFIQHALERAGYEVSFATDGRKAADLIGQMPIPDLITLDIDLPYATGDELMLKMLAAGERIEIFHHSGYWLDIGRPEDYELATGKFAANFEH